MYLCTESRRENVCDTIKSRLENVDNMYKRKIEKRLSEWFNTPEHKPLVVKGVRQCGKTSSVLAFAEKTFKNVVYLDFPDSSEQCNKGVRL